MIRFALFENSDKPDAARWAEKAARYLISKDAVCCVRTELMAQLSPDLLNKVKPSAVEDFGKYADIVISFGGDGTMLSASRALINSDIPIMGFNVGKLGFLAEFSVNELEKSLDALLDGKYRIVDRDILETTINGEILYGLNDFVIEKKVSSRMITVSVWANDHYIGDYRADGIIITTPTGSTAYSLSCGGPILAPQTSVICITPICPHSLTHRPLVIPNSNELRIQITSPNGQASFVADGHVEKTITNDDIVYINQSALRVKLVKPIDSSFYDLIRNKLLWAANTLPSK